MISIVYRFSELIDFARELCRDLADQEKHRSAQEFGM